MSYPRMTHSPSHIKIYAQLQHEYKARGLAPIISRLEREIKVALKEIKRLPIDRQLAAREPNALEAIRKLRPAGPRRLWQRFDRRQYVKKFEGALLGRMAGCTLGVPVEGWTIKQMQALARANRQAFPPTDYWTYVPTSFEKRYGISPSQAYARDQMNGVPVDDDIAYTLLGLLVVEAYGPHFTMADVGQAWMKYLPMACTAEKVALENLKKGIPARLAGARNNPYCEWIGADIRADPWGYLAPGWPERAAEMAYRDAYLSHRRQGIYGAMFFAAAIAAAFAVDDPLEALKIGLTEIPKQCTLAKAVRWALRVAPRIRNYRQAREAVDRRFKGMDKTHTINNACLTIFGLAIGRTDLTRVISETVAMGLDNDCTAATAGSIVGAVIGKPRIPKHWYRNFNNTVWSYLNGKRRFTITSLVHRFTRQARKISGV